MSGSSGQVLAARVRGTCWRDYLDPGLCDSEDDEEEDDNYDGYEDDDDIIDDDGSFEEFSDTCAESDMEGLDFTLFEPRQQQQQKKRSRCFWRRKLQQQQQQHKAHADTMHLLVSQHGSK